MAVNIFGQGTPQVKPWTGATDKPRVIHPWGMYTGPMRAEFGCNELWVTDGIKAVLEHKTRYRENWYREIFVIMTIRWEGVRRDPRPFDKPKVMDRLEALQARFPSLHLCSGVFGRAKGQPCSQILWFDVRKDDLHPHIRPVLVGLEEELAPGTYHANRLQPAIRDPWKD